MYFLEFCLNLTLVRCQLLNRLCVYNYKEFCAKIFRLRNHLLVCKLAPVDGGPGETRGGRPSRFVGVRFNKQESLWSLSWGWQDKQLSAPAHQDLRSLYRSLNGFSNRRPHHHITISRLCGAASRVVKASRVHILRTGRGMGSLWLPGSSSQVNWWSHPLKNHP